MFIKKFIFLFVLFLSSGVKAQSIFDQVRTGNVDAVKQKNKDQKGNNKDKNQ